MESRKPPTKTTKLLFIVFIVSVVSSKLFGIEVDSLTAITVAKNFYLTRLMQGDMDSQKGINQEISLDLVYREFGEMQSSTLNEKGGKPRTLYYIFNISDQNGFVIVSGDDQVPAILGYAFEGAYSEHNQPPAFKSWMDRYKNQIIYAIENDIKGNPEEIMDWDTYRDSIQSKGIEQIEGVSPLITTAWGQGCYYNYYCPYDSDGSCNHALTGCVAVAMAQIMKYWEHPYSCNSIPGYVDGINYDSDGNEIPGSDYGWIPAISSTIYNWSAMTSSLSSSSSQETAEAVGGLLYHCGVSVKMNFGPSSSSASSTATSRWP